VREVVMPLKYIQLNSAQAMNLMQITADENF